MFTSAFAAAAKVLHETLTSPVFNGFFAIVITPMVDGEVLTSLNARGKTLVNLLKLMICSSCSSRCVYGSSHLANTGTSDNISLIYILVPLCTYIASAARALLTLGSFFRSSIIIIMNSQMSNEAAKESNQQAKAMFYSSRSRSRSRNSVSRPTEPST